VNAVLTGMSILVADDHVDSLELLEYLLQEAGATVKSAGDAADVLGLLADWKPDVLLLDISLPDVDGYELLSSIRCKPGLGEVPAVAITGHAYEADRQRAEGAGFAVHVTKPYDPEALIHLVGKLGSNKAPENSPAQHDFVKVLRERGLHRALEFLNEQTAHRFTGVYRFDGAMLRSVALFDRLNPEAPRGDDAPMRETYCSIVGTSRQSFVTEDTEADARLLEHPARLTVRSYGGALLRNADATPFGSLCHFDLVPQPATDDALRLLELVAPYVSAEVAPPVFVPPDAHPAATPG